MGRSDKKIAKYTKLLLSWLEDAEKLQNQINSETNSKKIAKLNKKLESSKSMVAANGKFIGEAGGNLRDVIGMITPVQSQIINELFPYGMDSNDLKEQGKRNDIIQRHRNKILKIKEAQMSNPPYDPTLPFDVKMENKIFKLEKSLGVSLYDDSNKESSLYEPDWNYLEHMETSQEFTEEEKEIMDRCYKIGQEYYEAGGSWLDKLGQAVYDWGDITQSKVWCKKLYTNVFPPVIKGMNPGKQYTREEMEHESKEMTKRCIQFMLNEELHKPYVDKWMELYNDSRLAGYSEKDKNDIIIDAMTKAIGAEKVAFTSAYVGMSDHTKEALNQISQYTFEELGLN